MPGSRRTLAEGSRDCGKRVSARPSYFSPPRLVAFLPSRPIRLLSTPPQNYIQVVMGPHRHQPTHGRAAHIRLIALLLTSLALVATLALAYSSTASADLWGVPTGLGPDSHISAVAADLYNPSQGPSIVFSTWAATPGGPGGVIHLSQLLLNGKVQQIANVHGLFLLHGPGPESRVGPITSIAIAPNGEIFFIRRSQLFVVSPVDHSVSRVFPEGATALPTTDGTPLTINDNVRGVSVLSNGQIFLLLDENHGGVIVELNIGSRPITASVLAGGGNLELTNAPQPARSVNLGAGFGFAAQSAQQFFIHTLILLHPNGPNIGHEQAIVEISPNPSGQLSARRLSVPPPGFINTLALDPSGSLFYVRAKYIRGHTGPHSLHSAHQLLEVPPKSVHANTVIGEAAVPDLTVLLGEPEPLPDALLSFPGTAESGAVSAFPNGDLFIAPNSSDGQLIFRGSGPSEDELIAMLRDARKAAALGDVRAVRDIYQVLKRTESREFNPTSRVIHHILTTLNERSAAPLGKPEAKLNRDTAKVIASFLNLTDRPFLLIPLRARLAVQALEAFPGLHKIIVGGLAIMDPTNAHSTPVLAPA